MKQHLELIPVILFFIVYYLNGKDISAGNYSYHFDGIYSATTVLIASTVALVAWTGWRERKVEKRAMLLLGVVVIFGGLTLWLHNDMFIRWKPTIMMWIMASVFLGSQFIGDKPAIQRMLGTDIKMPPNAWTRLNLGWAASFYAIGALNLYVAYHYSQATWVNFKLASTLGTTIFMMIVSLIIMAPHMKDMVEPPTDESP